MACIWRCVFPNWHRRDATYPGWMRKLSVEMWRLNGCSLLSDTRWNVSLNPTFRCSGGLSIYKVSWLTFSTVCSQTGTENCIISWLDRYSQWSYWAIAWLGWFPESWWCRDDLWLHGSTYLSAGFLPFKSWELGRWVAVCTAWKYVNMEIWRLGGEEVQYVSVTAWGQHRCTSGFYYRKGSQV